MKKNELEKEIKKMGIPPSLYSLEGSKTTFGIVLEKMDNPDGYRVFSRGDKGFRSDYAEFPTEDRACDYMYKLILLMEQLLDEKIKSQYRIKE